ncbi:14572_t:CDS:2, partial [Gigaspora rosea]
ESLAYDPMGFVINEGEDNEAMYDIDDKQIRDHVRLQSVNYQRIGACGMKAIIKDFERSKLVDQSNRGKGDQMVGSVK